MSSRFHLRAVGETAEEPTSGAAALVLGRLQERRDELAHHSPRALRVAAEILAAAHELAYGHVPEIRCDRQVRYREAQLCGERAMPIEDLVAVSLESQRGLETTLAGLVIWLRELGYTIRALDGPPADIVTAAARAARAAGDAQAAITEALANDGDVDGEEAERIAPHISHAAAVMAEVHDEVQKRIAAHHAAKVKEGVNG